MFDWDVKDQTHWKIDKIDEKLKEDLIIFDRMYVVGRRSKNSSDGEDGEKFHPSGKVFHLKD